jgi:hypothetical protein
MHADKPRKTGKVADCVLAQKSAVTGEQRSFEIYNKKFLRIYTRKLRHKSKYDLRLGMMEPWPIRHRRVSWRWLGILAAMTLSTVVTAGYAYFQRSTVDYGVMVPVLVGLVFFSLATLFVFFVRSPNVTEFRSRYGGCVLISLFYNNPNNKEFSGFVETLKKRILVASQELAANKPQMLALELQELRRLSSEGVVADTDYAKAKDRIFKLHSNT